MSFKPGMSVHIAVADLLSMEIRKNRVIQEVILEELDGSFSQLCIPLFVLVLSLSYPTNIHDNMLSLL
jgi:hypothetical protein